VSLDAASEKWTAGRVAEIVLAAEAAATARGSINAEWQEFDVTTAYAAQDLALEMRRARGETVVGVKLGLTSRAKQLQMNVDEPSVAWLTDVMEFPEATPIPRDRMIHPRAEPEIVFQLGRRLSGPGVTAATAMASVSAVMGGIEIIDSRYSGFKFTLADGIADNNSSGRYVTGPVQLPPQGLDLSLEACLLEVNGKIIDSATGAAILGHPARALAFAANKLAERGHALEAGWIVLTGGLTEAVPVVDGARVAAHFTNLGSVTIAGG
jgi:2-oxo-3-hexenedioate decarboxylase